LRWTFESEQALWAKPLTDGKRIYIASMDHHIYALDPENGDEVWKTEDLKGAVMSSFVLSPEGILYVGTLGSNLLAVDASNGKILWEAAAKNWVWTKPLLANGTVYFGDQDGNVFALDAQTGAVRWQIQPDTTPNRAVISTPVLVEDTLYFGSQAGILYAVDAATGSVKWNKTIGGKIFSDLKLADDMILIAPLNFDAALVAVDLQGNNRWTFTPAK
jgi:outer membrane protein assembly factor BamB